jgi:uncharacterized membrane protein
MTPYILNLFDLVCTLCVMSIGVGELNPLFRDPHTIPAMIFYKVFVVGGLLWWLSRRTERIAHIGLKVCSAAYAAVTAWHIAGLYALLEYATL